MKIIMSRLRKPLLAAFSCALVAVLPAWAQTRTDSAGTVIAAVIAKPGIIAPLGFCTLSVSASAAQTSTCTGTFPATATYAAVCNEGSAARWRDDGTAPTASVGQPYPSGTATAPNCFPMATTFSTLQWIAQSGTATLDFTFYK